MRKIFFLVFILSFHVVARAQQTQSPRPNIIFLMTDDQQANMLGCMGDDIIQTPNLDKLAEQGMLFKRCYATTSICMASRATVMTGMYEFKTGCNFQTGNLSEADWNNLAYPVQLKKAGYRTAFAGKWGFGVGKKFDPSKFFDKWGRLEGGQGEYETHKNPEMASYAKEYPHITRALGAFGADFINESKDSKQPFCLSISFKAPHEPHNIVDPIDQKLYQDVEFPLPVSYGEKGLDLLPMQAKMSRQYEQRIKWERSHFQDHMRAYYQLISGVDAAVGMIVNALEEAGVADNTVIIYTSDNGYFCGSHGMSGKVMPYETAARIPLIVYDPRAPKKAKGYKTTALAANIDFAPTILDAAGLSIPKKMDGKSLLTTVNNPEIKVRKYLGLLQAWDVADRDLPKALTVVTEEHKYIKWCYADENVPEAEELFNLNEDSDEIINIAQNKESQKVLSEMQSAYDDFHQYWVDNSIGGEFYGRYDKIFDRNIPWEDKEFAVFPEKEPVRWEKWGKKFSKTYKKLTGADYPELPEIEKTPEMIKKEQIRAKKKAAKSKKTSKKH